MHLSDTALVMLNSAAQHPSHLVAFGKKMNAPQVAVVRKLIGANMLLPIEVPVTDRFADLAYRQSDRGGVVVLRVTDEGLRALGIDPTATWQAKAERKAERKAAKAKPAKAAVAAILDGASEGFEGPESDCAGLEASVPHQVEVAEDAPRLTLRAAVVAFLAAIGTEAEGAAVAAMRAIVAKPEREARGESKQDMLLAMLRRPEGASGPDMQERAGWQPHSVRGFVATLKGKGHNVTARKEGGLTVYRLAPAGQADQADLAL